jgi:hypothetical protein
MEKIPNTEFKSFSYYRAGNFSSASVEAKNGHLKENTLEIESITIKENWGPAVNFYLNIEGYKREKKMD